MKESDFYKPIIDGAAREGFRLFKIEDAGFNKKPFDITGVAPDGRGVAMEVKYIRGKVDLAWVLPLSDPKWFGPEREHQVAWCRQYARQGGLGLVVVIAGEGHLGGLDDNQERFIFRFTGEGTDLTEPLGRLVGASYTASWEGLAVACGGIGVMARGSRRG